MRGRVDWGPQLRAPSPSWEKAGYWGQPPFQGRAERRCSEEPGEMGQNLPFAKFPRNIETWELAAACRWNWGFTLAGDCHSMAQRSTCFRGMQHDAASYQSAQRQSSHGPLCPECVPEQKKSLKTTVCFTSRWWEYAWTEVIATCWDSLLSRYCYFLPHQQRNKHCNKGGKVESGVKMDYVFF